VRIVLQKAKTKKEKKEGRKEKRREGRGEREGERQRKGDTEREREREERGIRDSQCFKGTPLGHQPSADRASTTTLTLDLWPPTSKQEGRKTVTLACQHFLFCSHHSTPTPTPPPRPGFLSSLPQCPEGID
jgi:hypothetical protein